MHFGKRKSAGNPAHQCDFRKLQTGEHGSVIFVVQIGTDFAGLDTAVVDRGEQEVGAAQNGRNKENGHHEKGLTFKKLQDTVKAV